MSAKGLWLGGKNGQRVQAEATGCGCREVRGSADAREIPVLEGREPGPYSLVLSPLCSLCLYPHKGCHCPNQCFWDCLQLGLFPPLWSCALDGRMRLRPTVLSCPVLSLLCLAGSQGRGAWEQRRHASALHGAVWGLPLRGPKPGKDEPGNLPSEDSIPPPFPGKQRIHTNWTLTLTLCFGSRWVLFIVLWASSLAPARSGPAARLSGQASTFSSRILCLSN